MTKQEAIESLKFEVYEEGHCSYIEEELDIAIEALEKQIPKDIYIYANGTEHCPTCDHDITQISYDDVYCSRCGQKLKKGD